MGNFPYIRVAENMCFSAQEIGGGPVSGKTLEKLLEEVNKLETNKLEINQHKK